MGAEDESLGLRDKEDASTATTGFFSSLDLKQQQNMAERRLIFGLSEGQVSDFAQGSSSQFKSKSKSPSEKPKSKPKSKEPPLVVSYFPVSQYRSLL
ncbi:hypothetical protein ACSQ67_009936 [Phaseolus vulgaris]